MKGRWAGRIGGLLALAVLGAVAAGSADAAIYDDGNDRKILFDLRLKPESRLTDEERMILRAADSYGNVGFCSKAGGNATLIDYFGRPAIVTSAHLFFDTKTGKQKCSDAELRNASHMPNVTYHDGRGNHPASFTHRRVELVMPPANGGAERRMQGSTLHPQDDFVIFYLKEDIAGDIMPGGHPRGAMEVSTKPSAQGDLFMIGVAPDIKKGEAVLYQICDYQNVRYLGMRHTCDTVAGSSASALLVVEDGRLKLRGLHQSSIDGSNIVEETSSSGQWNLATDLLNNPKFQAPEGGPIRNAALIPYQLQFLLHRAGCYTGRLDNQWGPGSRKALDAFVSRTEAKLPGRDPSMALWDALEDAAKQHGEACR